MFVLKAMEKAAKFDSNDNKQQSFQKLTEVGEILQHTQHGLSERNVAVAIVRLVPFAEHTQQHRHATETDCTSRITLCTPAQSHHSSVTPCHATLSQSKTNLTMLNSQFHSSHTAKIEMQFSKTCENENEFAKSVLHQSSVI